MHIAFVTVGNYKSHATLKRATGMTDSLQRLGHKSTVILEDHPANHAKVAADCPEASPVYYSPGLSCLRERRLKQDLLTDLQPDVIWLCGVGLRNWVRKTHQRQLLIGDHSELLSAITELPLLRRGWDYMSEWLHLAAFDGHVCASRYLERLYSRRLAMLGKPNAVHYSPYAYSQRSHEQEHSVPVENPLSLAPLMYMGSFRENYGFWDMLHVFREIHAERPSFTVEMIGRGPEESEGRRWLRTNNVDDRIRIKGFVPDEELGDYLSGASAFICPLRNTIQDTARCPSKLYMYLPYEKPIITCPIGDAYDLLGSSGVYYTPRDRKSLKQAIYHALEIPPHLPRVDPALHTWDARAESFLRWLETTYPHATI